MWSGLLDKYRSLPKQVKASAWFLICSFLQRGISVLTTPVFTRLLSTAEYGGYNVFNSWLGIVSIFVSLNLSGGVFGQGLVKFDKERTVFASSLQGLTVTLVFTWTVVYLIFRNFWNNLFSMTTLQMLAMLLMIWTSAVFGFWAAEQRVKLSYAKLVVVTLIMSVAKPVIGIIFVVNANDKVTARVLGIALVELIGYCGLFVSQMKRGKKFFSAHFWKYAVLFNLPLIPHYLSQTVLGSADRIMIESMVGESEAGIYSLAYSISMVMILFNTALGYTIGPWVYQKIKDKKEKSIEPIAYTSLVMIACVNIMLIALAPEIITLFAPPSYHAAIWVIPPVAMSVYFIFAYDLFSQIEFYFEKTKLIMIASVIAALINIVLNYIFIPHYGYVAGGYTTLFCYIVYAICHYVFMRKICNDCIDGVQIYSGKKLLFLTTVFLAVGFVFMLTYNYLIWRYVLMLGLCLMTFIKRKIILKNLKMVIQNRQKQEHF